MGLTCDLLNRHGIYDMMAGRKEYSSKLVSTVKYKVMTAKHEVTEINHHRLSQTHCREVNPILL